MAWPAPSAAQTSQADFSGAIVIRVRDANGTPLRVFAMVRLTGRIGSFRQEAPTQDDVQVMFRNVPVGEYRVRVSAAGYVTTEQDVTVYAGESHVFVMVRSEGSPSAQPAAGNPVLAPRAKKHFDEAVQALKKNDLTAADGALERVVKLAPGYPDAYYLLGVISRRRKDEVLARTQFEKTISIDPGHDRALLALGRLHYDQKQYDDAARVLEQGLARDNVNWQGHWVMALTQLARKEFARARTHAERAAQLAGEKAPQLALLVAEACIALHENDRAAATLERFLKDYPRHSDAGAARAHLERLRQTATPTSGTSNGNGGTRSPVSSLPEPDTESELPAIGWPAGIEALPTTVDHSVPCSLASVLRSAGRQVERLVENLQGVTARERIEAAEFSRRGEPGQPNVHLYEYMMLIQEPRRGVIYIEEDRRAIGGSGGTNRLTSEGLPALALVLHPYYASDYEMKCDGLSQVDGRPAWQVHFKQRTDRESRVRVYRTRAGRFPVPLQGRAWLDSANYQILRIETDMVHPLPEAQLQAERLSIRYAPVLFEQRNVRLWLPKQVDLFTNFRKRRLHMRHSFSDFTYFSVDVKQKIQDPKVDTPPAPPSAK